MENIFKRQVMIFSLIYQMNFTKVQFLRIWTFEPLFIKVGKKFCYCEFPFSKKKFIKRRFLCSIFPSRKAKNTFSKQDLLEKFTCFLHLINARLYFSSSLLVKLHSSDVISFFQTEQFTSY